MTVAQAPKLRSAARCFLLAGLSIFPLAAQHAPREQSMFGNEGNVSKPMDLPKTALRVMRKNAFVLSCLEKDQVPEHIPGDWFVASAVHLKNGETDIVVMPRTTSEGEATNGCLLGAHTGPFWILTKNQNAYTLVLEENTQVLQILSSRSNGYRDIETKARNLNESTTWVYSFDGHKYALKKKTSTPN